MATTGELMVCVGDIPLPVATDCSLLQYHAFYINEAKQADLGGPTTNNCMILQDKPAAANRAGAFRMHGISKCVYGGAVISGDELIADSSGHLVNRGSTTAVHVLGIALDDGASGDIGSVLLAHFHI